MTQKPSTHTRLRLEVHSTIHEEVVAEASGLIATWHSFGRKPLDQVVFERHANGDCWMELTYADGLRHDWHYALRVGACLGFGSWDANSLAATVILGAAVNNDQAIVDNIQRQLASPTTATVLRVSLRPQQVG